MSWYEHLSTSSVSLPPLLVLAVAHPLQPSELVHLYSMLLQNAKALLQLPQVDDFWLRVEHQESLHAHDAVAVATRGVEGGYTAQLNL